jgi:hypothetical protein
MEIQLAQRLRRLVCRGRAWATASTLDLHRIADGIRTMDHPQTLRARGVEPYAPGAATRSAWITWRAA